MSSLSADVLHFFFFFFVIDKLRVLKKKKEDVSLFSITLFCEFVSSSLCSALLHINSRI